MLESHVCFFRLGVFNSSSAQHSVPEVHRDNAPDPRQPRHRTAGAIVVGVGAFSGNLRGLKLVPSKWRYFVPPTSGYPAESMRGRQRAVGWLASIMISGG